MRQESEYIYEYQYTYDGSGEYTIPFFTMPFEQWLPIPENYPGLPNIREGYWISNKGRVASTLYKTPRLKAPRINHMGYDIATFQTVDKKSIYRSVHRTEMLIFNFNPNFENLEVNHRNGWPTDNWIYNLEWVTPQENIQHAIMTGLLVNASGESAGLASITYEQADQIGYLLSTMQYNHSEIARMVGVNDGVVHQIAAGNTWRPIWEKYNLERVYKRFGRNRKPTFTEEEAHLVCQYVSDHNITSADIYRIQGAETRNAILAYAGKEPNKSTMRTLRDILSGRTYRSVSEQYNIQYSA